MSAVYTDPTNLQLLKNVYGKLVFELPANSIVQKLFPFSSSDSVGSQYVEALNVRTSWGYTPLGSAGTEATLVDAQASVTLQAQVPPFSGVLQDKITYALMDRGPDGAKAKAFIGTSGFAMKNLAMQMRRILEVQCLTGQSGWATVSSYSSSGTGSVVITDPSFRPGVLAMLEGALIDVVRAGQVVADGSTASNSSGIVVSAVDMDNKTITFAALPFCGNASATPQAGDTLVFHLAAGPTTGNAATNVAWAEMIGLRAQISTTSGTQFGLNKATYVALRGNNVSNIGPISAGSILKAASKALNRGLEGEAVVLLSPLSFAELNSRNIAQQVFDSSYSVQKAKDGSDEIEIYSQGVKLRCISHPYMADGEFMILPDNDDIKRIGSAYEDATNEDGAGPDISFLQPGTDLKFIQPLPGTNTVIFQVRTDQQIFLSTPPHAVLATGVTHT